MDDADIGDDHLEIVWRERCADQVFDFGDVLFGDFDAGAGGNFHVDGELAGVGPGEKCEPEERDKSRGWRRKRRAEPRR